MKMHVYGDGEKVAVLLHGMGSSSSSWSKLIDDLVLHGYQVYAPDMPGHGLAERDKTLYNLLKWEELLLAHIPQADLLIGHSMGGLLAVRVRSLLKPSRTVLIDPVLRFPTGFLKPIVQFFFSGVMKLDLFSKNEIARLNQKNWDPYSVRMIESPKGLVALDSSVLVVRPSNSFVAPLSRLKIAHGVNILTFKRADHNLHMGKFYEQFFAALKDFAILENNLVKSPS